MNKRDETILIRLASETKERFRELCEGKNSTMSKVLLDEIERMILNFQLSNETSDMVSLIRERNFYKKELDLYKQTYSKIHKTLSELNKNNIINEENLYCDLILENFEKIEQFDGFKIIKNHKSKVRPDFIAINKSLNCKLLIDTISCSIDSIFMGTRREYYKRLLNKYMDNEELQLVLISLNPVSENNSEQRIKDLSKKIGHKTTIHFIDDILNIL